MKRKPKNDYDEESVIVTNTAGETGQFLQLNGEWGTPGKRTDSERLDWLETKSGWALISDDDVHWALSGDGFQNVPINPPSDVETSFFVPKADWKKSIRDAIDVEMDKGV